MTPKKKNAAATAAPSERHVVAIGDLETAAYNARTIGAGELEALKVSLREFGMVQELVVNRGTDGERMRVVGGHQRLRAALELGWTEVPCVFVELDDQREMALNVALNSSKLQGTWTGALAGLLESMDAGDDLMDALRFDELAEDVAAAAAQFATPAKQRFLSEPNDPGKLPTEPLSRRGDLWILGRHRLLCGDSTNGEDVASVLAGARPELMVTDPPYGVAYDAEWRNRDGLGAASTGAVSNDHRASWASAFMHFPGNVAYVWHAANHSACVERSLSAIGFELRQQIVWVKHRFAISRGNYHWRHEPCWYAVRKGETAEWRGGRKLDTVWADIVDLPAHERADLFAGRVDDDRVLVFSGSETTVWEIRNDVAAGAGHSTQKPVECMARPMRSHGPADGDVFDPFLGSGSTIIAAEMEGRRCLGLEIEPRYVDGIVNRWEAFTGQQAKRPARLARARTAAKPEHEDT